MSEKTPKEDLVFRLERAARTMKALPYERGSRHRQLQSAWIDISRESDGIPQKMRRNIPESQHIDELYMLLDLLLVRPDLERKLIWARANRIPWAALQKRTGRSRTHLYMIYNRGLLELVSGCLSKNLLTE